MRFSELIRKRRVQLAAAAVLVLAISVTVALAMPGQILDNSGLIPFDQAFFAFEVEGPTGSLKDVPIWNEIEAMLDDPYAIELAPDVRGNDQGWPSYRSTLPRRRSFLPHGCTYENPVPAGMVACDDSLLPRFLVHPLNYNHSTGMELRLINPDFEGYEGFLLPEELIQCGAGDPEEPAACADEPMPNSSNKWVWEYEAVDITPGEERFEEDEPAIDFNLPIASDPIPLTSTCIVSTEATPAEGAIICGGDPGEPGYAGFGVLLPDTATQYSVPAAPGLASPTDSLVAWIQNGGRLFDPERGFIEPLDPVTGEGGLEKPTLQNDEAGGEPGEPNYAVNSTAALADDPTLLRPSNENDYVRDRDAAVALGKALFWDMQVGSDGVQACASCHFHAGADDRDRNQLNPNTVGGDVLLEVFNNRAMPQNNNQAVVATDFPFHRLIDPLVVGDPACVAPLVVDGPAGPQVVCDAANIASTTNDVMSSMGVIFGVFGDIPTPGGGRGSAAFIQTPGAAPRTLAPDIRAGTVDPFNLFQGLRRVEPRHTPTFIASAMNFDNFWDGRARHDFNGGSVFGAADPFHHVYACTELNPPENNCRGELVATRQIIRFASLASLATGPVLSEFEMSFVGRNWAKMGKKLLQPGVVPLANQLVDPHDSALGPYSNQPGNANPICSNNQARNQRALGKPGLCITYPDLIQKAFYPALWVAKDWHLVGAPAPCTGTAGPGERTPAGCDGFDGYVLSIAAGDLSSTPDLNLNTVPDGLEDTNKFTHMEGNMALFFGLSVHIWGNVLIPDDSPMDQFFDANPDSFATFGESGEPGIAVDLLNCEGENNTGGVQPCLTEVGNFRRDPGVIARIGVTVEGGTGGELIPSGGTRGPDDPDPLLGLDMFLGSNLSLKNPSFRSFRCGECHAGGTLTDHTFEISHQLSFGDRIQEFVTGQPGLEIFPEALGRGRIISGFLLEAELGENAQDAVERNIADFTLDVLGAPQGQALFDNGVYNIGVTPIGNDVSRGGDDPFAWPLSLSILALKNLGGPDYHPGGNNPANGFAQPPYPGIPLPTFDPLADPECIGLTPDEWAATAACNTGGLFEENSQDQEINPGFAEEPENPLLPPYLAPWASNIPVGDESNIDEVFFGLNTLMAEPMLEGFNDTLGPFNPAAIIGEVFNNADGRLMAAWPNVNRVNVQGAFKAPPLRFVELTAPFFHNGGMLTLRQVVDFYMRGGDFPISNSAHRDFLITHLNIEDEALGDFTEPEKEARRVALVDFLLELTDDRVRFQQAPFDQPEIFVPLDGRAPDNTFGRAGFLSRLTGICPGGSVACFRQIPATGAGGSATPIGSFLNVERGDRNNPNCSVSAAEPISHYCSEILP